VALKLDVIVDGRTDRLLRIARATRLTGALPKESGGQLVNLAQAVREFSLAQEHKAALSVVDDIMEMVRSAEQPHLTTMFDRHATLVRKALSPTERS
jgi:hypothetical protein